MEKEMHDYYGQAEGAAAVGDWQTAAQLYQRCVEQRAAELALINSVQEGLSDRLEMQAIYDLVGDKLRDTFNAQVVMISQYDPGRNMVYHHYAIERGQYLTIEGWQPIDSSRAEIVRTGKPFIINSEEITDVVDKGNMWVIPGTEMPRTWLGVPMLVGSDVCGIVSLQNLDKPHAFSKSDIDLLTTLTNSMSLSLENARLFSETERLLNMLDSEMKIARRTQQSILPQCMPAHTGYDVSALIKPARAVGGDLYDFIQVSKNHLGLVIGDVSDKGLPAALFMALTFSLLHAETERSDDPRAILQKVNGSLLKMNASGMFVTLLYGILDYRTGIFEYARAGHPPPIVMDHEGNVMPVGIQVGQPLGVFSEVTLDVQNIRIPRGGMALLFSDGLNETTNGYDDEFGLRRIQETLSRNRDCSADIICSRLWEAVETHRINMPRQDDFTVALVKRMD